MENIGVRRFDNEKPNDDHREIIVGLADLGSISKPGVREISALTYRSPEVHFRKPWDERAQMSGHGGLLSNNTALQLLLAQVNFESPGMYDSISVGTLENKTKVARDAVAI
ncbi:tRNA modification GTPase MnmE, partial [Madurella mycetomatis]